jgi:hypothetical protein
MLIELFIASRLSRAADSLRKLEPDTFDTNAKTVDAVERGLDRLYYRIHKKKFEKMRMEEQLGEIPRTPREVDIPSED